MRTQSYLTFSEKALSSQDNEEVLDQKSDDCMWANSCHESWETDPESSNSLLFQCFSHAIHESSVWIFAISSFLHSL